MYILLIVPLIVLTGVFAMAEIALVSVRKPRLQQWTVPRPSQLEQRSPLSTFPLSLLWIGGRTIDLAARTADY